jgi:hypothetical protein
MGEVLTMKRMLMLFLGLLLVLPFITQSEAVIQPAPYGNAKFFQDYQCETGNYIQLKKGNYPDLRSYNTGALGSPSWNDQISCMVIGDGVSKVIVYEHINYKGKSKTFTRTSSNPLGSWSLSGDWWNDNISSIKVQ